jgi:hypothetical protein
MIQGQDEEDRAMALIKILRVGDELQFDLRNKVANANIISVMLVEKAGKSQVVLKIAADRSIPITLSKQVRLGEATRQVAPA